MSHVRYHETSKTQPTLPPPGSSGGNNAAPGGGAYPQHTHDDFESFNSPAPTMGGTTGVVSGIPMASPYANDRRELQLRIAAYVSSVLMLLTMIVLIAANFEDMYRTKSSLMVEEIEVQTGLWRSRTCNRIDVIVLSGERCTSQATGELTCSILKDHLFAAGAFNILSILGAACALFLLILTVLPNFYKNKPHKLRPLRKLVAFLLGTIAIFTAIAWVSVRSIFKQEFCGSVLSFDKDHDLGRGFKEIVAGFALSLVSLIIYFVTCFLVR